MYTAIDNNILDKLQGLEITCYMSIRKFMNWQTRKAKVGVRRIAFEMGCSKNTALKYIKKLIDKEVILKRTNYNPERKEYDVNEYFFLHLVQKENNSSTPSRIKQKSLDNDKNMSIQTIKDKLFKKYDNSIVQKALQCLKRATEHGTVVNHLLNYLNAICSKIKAQMELCKDATNYDMDNKQKSKNPTVTSSRTSKKTKFHNFEQRTSKYSAKELEDMVRYKFK